MAALCQALDGAPGMAHVLLCFVSVDTSFQMGRFQELWHRKSGIVAHASALLTASCICGRHDMTPVGPGAEAVPASPANNRKVKQALLAIMPVHVKVCTTRRSCVGLAIIQVVVTC